MNRSYFMILTVSLYLIGCAKAPVSSEYEPPAEYLVVYEVTGTGACVNASLTYQNSSDDTEQIAAATLPWTYTITTRYSKWRYISAQNNFGSGSITTTIYKKGVLQKTTTSSGGYVIATCSGTY